jgi:hypothetical protein
LLYEFTPLKPGKNYITGRYYEIDGTKEDFDEGWGGDKEWTFEYIAIK